MPRVLGRRRAGGARVPDAPAAEPAVAVETAV
jgi:hypothetical protein